jgi:hypothetical protein
MKRRRFRRFAHRLPEARIISGFFAFFAKCEKCESWQFNFCVLHSAFVHF